MRPTRGRPQATCLVRRVGRPGMLDGMCGTGDLPSNDKIITRVAVPLQSGGSASGCFLSLRAPAGGCGARVRHPLGSSLQSGADFRPRMLALSQPQCALAQPMTIVFTRPLRATRV
jgi:hypothetical protein